MVPCLAPACLQGGCCPHPFRCPLSLALLAALLLLRHCVMLDVPLCVKWCAPFVHNGSGMHGSQFEQKKFSSRGGGGQMVQPGPFVVELPGGRQA